MNEERDDEVVDEQAAPDVAPEPSQPSETTLRWLRTSLAGLALLTSLAFAVSTEQAWEDFFINYRHSENLVEGKGLTFNEGTRVHGFTSPLATLAAAGARALTGPAEPGTVLWVYRVPSLLAHAAALALLLLALHRAGMRSILGTVLVGGLYIIDTKSLAFSVNGMETGFLLFFLAGALAVLCSGVVGRERWLGACWAGLMWTRPDGCVLIAAMGLAVLLFSERPRRELFTALVKAALTCTVLYLPWFVGAWWYYGSPVPHPVVAKAARSQGLLATLSQLDELLPQLAFLHLPPYAWSYPLRWVQIWEAGVLGAVGCLGFLWRGAPLGVRRVSFCALIGVLYLTFIPLRYPWYYPATFLCTLAVPGWLVGAIDWYLWRDRLLRTMLVVGVVVVLLGLLPAALDYHSTAKQAQRINDGGVRTEVGRWLAENTDPTHRVFGEPAGYVGYYSERRLVDYPGLVSPEVVAVRQEKDDPSFVVEQLRPEWLVLRPHELASIHQKLGTWLETEYVRVVRFDASGAWPQELRDRFPSVRYDARFEILGRRDVAAGVGER
ncbi:MAG: hypothetical protein AAF533_29150 [Acidobacteriota bacterium]